MQGNNLHALIAELQTELTKEIEWLNINKLRIKLLKMLIVLCTLFIYINIIPTRQKIHLI